MDDVDAQPTQGDAGVIGRLRMRGADLAKGRRLVLPLPGWDDLGDGRGLWARFVPITRSAQLQFSRTPDDVGAELDFIAPQIAAACEEVLIGMLGERGKLVTTRLADEPGVPDVRGEWGGPMGFDVSLGQVVGVGGDTPAAVVKRMLCRSNGDDIAMYAVWSELLAWSGTVHTQGVEVAAGE